MEDHRVERRTLKQISSEAKILRDWAFKRNHGRNHLDLIDIAEHAFAKLHITKRHCSKKFPFQVILDERRPESSPAKVGYYPLTMRIHPQTWEAAKVGDPFAREVLAHEFGHLILHDARSKGYSDSLLAKDIQFPPEESAERQADDFKCSLLMPRDLIFRLKDPFVIATTVGLPIDTAQEWVEFNQNESWWSKASYGDCICPTCGSIIAQEKAKTRCYQCGYTNEST